MYLYAYRTKVLQFLHLSLCAIWWEAGQLVDSRQLSRVVDRVDHKQWSLNELVGILQQATLSYYI